MNRSLKRWAPALACTALALTVVAALAYAATSPSITATPQQVRTRVKAAVIPVPLWDTSWWVDLQAMPGAAPLAHIEYSARYRDAVAAQAVTGRWDVDPADGHGFAGRVMVTCASRRDYDRKVQVRLRVVDGAGVATAWVEVNFPLHGVATEAGPTPVADSEAASDPRGVVTGSVEVEVPGNTTVDDVKRALEAKAHAAGGDAISNLRVVRTSADQAAFAADVIRYPSEPTPTATPPPAAQSAERVLGEIVMPRGQR